MLNDRVLFFLFACDYGVSVQVLPSPEMFNGLDILPWTDDQLQIFQSKLKDKGLQKGMTPEHKISYVDWTSRLLQENVIKESYRKADLMYTTLGMHHGRNKNCESLPDRGFPFQVHSESLRKPEAEDWLSILRGKRTVFLGDSVTRDFFTSMVRSLIDHMQMHSSKENWMDYHFGVNQAGGAIEAQFSENVTLQYWWAPTELSDDNWESLASADLVIFNLGAHYTRQGDLMAAISYYWDRALSRIAAKRGLIWMQYPSPHFPWGLGEFEDQPPIHSSTCSPAGADVSPVSSIRLSADGFFDEKEVPILRLWNASRPLWNNHPPSPGNGGSEYNGAIDCRHWCSPGLSLHVWERLLYLLLQADI